MECEKRDGIAEAAAALYWIENLIVTNMSLCNLSSKINIRIYYEDTDARVVYHSKYLNFAERARAEFLRNLSLEQTYIKEKYQVQFSTKPQVSYIYSCKLDDQINLVTDLEALVEQNFTLDIFYKDKKNFKNSSYSMLYIKHRKSC